MLMFDTPDRRIVWVEPNFVVSVEDTDYDIKGGKIRTATIETLKERFVVVDPNRDVGRKIAAMRAERAGELSYILSLIARAATSQNKTIRGGG